MAQITKFRKFGTKAVPLLNSKVAFNDIVNDTTSGGTLLPLSAEMGKTLQSNLNTEISDRQSAITALKGGVTSANSTLGKIETNLNQEISDRQAAITATEGYADAAVAVEKTRAEGVEASIIATVSTNATTASTNLAAEVTRATGEEARIEGKVDANKSAADSSFATLNGDATVAGSIDQKISVETARATAAEGQLSTDISTENTRATTAEATLQSNIDAVDSTVTSNFNTLQSNITTEATTRASADTALSSRLTAVEGTLVAGVYWKGSVADLAALDALVEADILSGQAYYVTAEKDVYVVLPDDGGDYQPAGYTTKSFLKIADFAELTGLVNAEKNRAEAEETRIESLVTTEVTTRGSEITRVEGLITAEETARQADDVVLQGNIDAEETARISAVSTLDAAYKAADTILDTKINTEISDRTLAVSAEETRAIGVEGGLNTRITILEGDNLTAGSVAFAVKTETDRALLAEAANATAITDEVTNRTNAINTEITDRQNADNALDARLDVLEDSYLVAGSVANAEYNARAYADVWIPQAKLEGMGGTLTVANDTVTLTYAPLPDGIINGEVVVYAGDNDEEAIAVNITNVAGTVVTLDVLAAGEFDGKLCKVHYLFREGDQSGAGMGLAGQGGAGD